MAQILNKRSANSTFEVFDLDLDAQARTELAADPAAFIRKTIAAEGAAPPNRVVIGDGVLPNVASGPIRMYHQILPPEDASTYIVINAA